MNLSNSKLIEELHRGVQSERHGNMEIDTFSANQLMLEAATAIERLEKRLARLDRAYQVLREKETTDVC